MNLIKAFAVGGALCAAAQLLIDKTAVTPAKILTGYVVLGVILGALRIFEPLADFAGAGVTVPLLGYGNSLAEGVRKAVTEKGALGILTGGLTACAGGLTAAIVFSFAAALVSRSKAK
ncbi:MAG: SpoVA/SpoVAEb family sporulation membrane protein [Oscillospiraceae bacterium]|nr:SpoVA/SpoVAEb family sporulation membrane protein [Oscillospiraceae bacterium]